MPPMLVILCLALYHKVIIFAAWYAAYVANAPLVSGYKPWSHVLFFGLLGGCTYCLRALYLQHCVEKEWDDRWVVWHIIRPCVGAIMGVFSLISVKVGLLVLVVAEEKLDDRLYGIYALAFIAGYNVDYFQSQIRRVTETVKNASARKTTMGDKGGDS